MEDIERVKAFVRESIHQIRSINDIATAFDISRETLRKNFVRYQKKRLSQFVAETRVEEMKHLLSVTRRPCNDICLAVGFSREEVGERVFKRKTGMTMKGFRNNLAMQIPEESPPSDVAACAPVKRIPKQRNDSSG